MLHSESKKVTNGILDMKWYNELLYLERTAFNSVNYNIIPTGMLKQYWLLLCPVEK